MITLESLSLSDLRPLVVQLLERVRRLEVENSEMDDALRGMSEFYPYRDHVEFYFLHHRWPDPTPIGGDSHV